MILTGPEIDKNIALTKQLQPGSPTGLNYGVQPAIWIDDPAGPAGPNSIDIRLGPTLKYYHPNMAEIDSAHPEKNVFIEVEIPKEGFVLQPFCLYLGTTHEKTATAGLVPWIDGKSTTGRYGMMIHVTAGRGDVGFGLKNPGGCSWTLEMLVPHRLPVRVYHKMLIGQITYFMTYGEVKDYDGHYAKQEGPTGPAPIR